ncbi:hypothetical protein EJB05_12684 [Eragrostis curvula]|uniref:Uncharacterized protein n=1 Tax=Eragrostis curvula TaxID=38414 RepID=A0A5J9VU47_9POAL|nr:hypothetical protein EJB05_12684 [Eragrostis curvula]
MNIQDTGGGGRSGAIGGRGYPGGARWAAARHKHRRTAQHTQSNTDTLLQRSEFCRILAINLREGRLISLLLKVKIKIHEHGDMVSPTVSTATTDVFLCLLIASGGGAYEFLPLPSICLLDHLDQ